MPWASRRVKIGQMYGAGSLKYAPRFVIGTKNQGRTVVFRVGSSPPCAPRRISERWKTDEVYEMPRKDFFRWVDAVLREHGDDVANNTENTDT